ncbi:MAG: YIP1 family protein [bacterium]
MDIYQLLATIRILLVQPDKGWHLIKEAGYSWQQILGYFLMPLVFASSLAMVFFMGNQLQDTPLSPNQMFFITFAGSVVAILLSAWMIATMAPRFKGESSLDETIALIAFSYTPVYLASIIASLHEALQIFNLVAMVYMLFLFFKGTAVIIKVPAYKQLGFTITSVIILFAVRLLISLLLAGILGGFDMAS